MGAPPRMDAALGACASGEDEAPGAVKRCDPRMSSVLGEVADGLAMAQAGEGRDEEAKGGEPELWAVQIAGVSTQNLATKADDLLQVSAIFVHTRLALQRP